MCTFGLIFLILIVKLMQNCDKLLQFLFWVTPGYLTKKNFFWFFWKLKVCDSTLILINRNKKCFHHWILTLNFVHFTENIDNYDILMFFQLHERGLICLNWPLLDIFGCLKYILKNWKMPLFLTKIVENG